MRCEQCRVSLSARLDGEEPPEAPAAVDAHLAGCAGCRGWLHDAARVTRLARMAIVTPAPDPTERVLEALPRPGRVAAGLRAALLVVGGSQLLLGLAQVTASTHLHGPGSADHLWHESAAWNVALGAGFVWIAVHRVAVSALVPVLSAFVGLLTLLSANDLWSGRVEPGRLLTHALVVAGYVVVLGLHRYGHDRSGHERAPARWQARFDET